MTWISAGVFFLESAASRGYTNGGCKEDNCTVRFRQCIVSFRSLIITNMGTFEVYREKLATGLAQSV
jgi:hypothetical protein